MGKIYRNIVVVGDRKCGKTSFLRAVSGKEMCEEYSPTRFHNSQVTVVVEDQKFQLHLRDTSGRLETFAVRKSVYSRAHIVFLCFSIVDPHSLENVISKWYEEAMLFTKDAPKFLIGCKMDLIIEEETNEQSQSTELRDIKHPVPYSEGAAIASELQLCGYFECSAKTGEGIEQALLAVVNAPVQEHRSDWMSRTRNCCNIM